MRVLITGSSGQLGIMLQSKLVGQELALVDLPEIDICDREQIFSIVNSFQPDVIIHCAAYTNVDGCVSNPELAYRVNSLGTQNVALACRRTGAAMVHLSTNEVFAGDRPDGYEEWMMPDPQNIYGRTKAAGEYHVRSILQQFYIVRTAWLYAPGGRNFIHAILRQAQKGGRLRVVADEIGNPTSAKDLAEAIVKLINTGQFGTYHLVNEGACSRFEFAQQVLQLGSMGNAEIVPIMSSDHKRASTPPPYGALNNICGSSIGIRLRPWRAALAEYIAEHVSTK
jgi:dTDP-4-dehydrorhamnose reductase